MAAEYVTLGEAGNLRQAVLDPYIIPTIISQSPILSGGFNVPPGAYPSALPFKVINDRTLTIVRQDTIPTVAWRDPGEPVSGEEVTHTQASFTIRGLKTAVPIPREIAEGYSSQIDQASAQLDYQLVGMTKALMDAFYYGDNATNSKEPSGVHKLCSLASPDMEIAESSSDTASALNLTNLDDLLSRMKNGVDMLVMPKELYLRFTAAARNTATGVAGLVRYELQDWGKPALTYGGVPIYRDDFLTLTEATSSDTWSDGTSGAGGSILALKFGPKHLHAVTFSSVAPRAQLQKGPVYPYDSDILWLFWDVAIVMRSPYSIGRICGISDAAIAA